MNQIGPDKNILHEDRKFRLYATNDRTGSFLAHACVRTLEPKKWYAWRTQRCGLCGEDPSDEIRGLYLLHNWDRLQKPR